MMRRLWEGWKRVGRVIGNFQARLMLTIFYIVLIAPLGLLVRVCADPMRIRHPRDKWLDRDPDGTGLIAAQRQW